MQSLDRRLCWVLDFGWVDYTYSVCTVYCMDQSGFFDLNFNLTSEKVLCVHDYTYCVLVGCRLPMVTTTTVKTTIPVSDFRPLNGLID